VARVLLESCVYRVTTRRNLRLGPDQDLVSLSTRVAMIDRIVAVGQSEDYEPHMVRHIVSNFRIQAASESELRAQANFQILRTFPERPTEYFVSAATATASRSPRGACTSAKKSACSTPTFRPTRWSTRSERENRAAQCAILHRSMLTPYLGFP